MKKLFTIILISALAAAPITVYAAKKVAAKKTAAKTTKTQSKTQSKTKVDYNCSDFSTWQAAQDTFIKAGGTAKDIYDLDRDHDGIACDDLKK